MISSLSRCYMERGPVDDAGPICIGGRVAKRKSYSDDFRASAVIMLESQGYPHVKGALTAVANHLNVPARTLSRWFNKEQNPPPDQLVKEKKGTLEERLTDLLDEFVTEMFSARVDAPLNHVATSFGIVFDKLQLLRGEPTERIKQDVDISDSRERIAHLIDRHASRFGTPSDLERSH